MSLRHQHYLLKLLIIFFFSLSSMEASISILNNLTHVYETSGGNTLRGHIDIKGIGDTDQFVKIYQTDYFFDHLGNVNYDEPGTNKRSNAKWIDLDADYVTIPVGEIIKFQFNIHVPSDSLFGTYWSVIMVESIAEPDTTDQEGVLNITSTIRYAIQIVTNIEGTGIPNLEFLDVKLLDENNQEYLEIDLLNSGDVFLQPYLKIELYDEKGNKANVYKTKKRKIYPGTSVQMRLDLTGIKPGKYQALLIADSGMDDIFGINLNLEI